MANKYNTVIQGQAYRKQAQWTRTLRIKKITISTTSIGTKNITKKESVKNLIQINNNYVMEK